MLLAWLQSPASFVRSWLVIFKWNGLLLVCDASDKAILVMVFWMGLWCFGGLWWYCDGIVMVLWWYFDGILNGFYFFDASLMFSVAFDGFWCFSWLFFGCSVVLMLFRYLFDECLMLFWWFFGSCLVWCFFDGCLRVFDGFMSFMLNNCWRIQWSSASFSIFPSSRLQKSFRSAEMTWNDDVSSIASVVQTSGRNG